ncbi:hypothetical protein OAF54_01110 [bacterium]|nr:hypothetical protein [bacterium]
MLATAPQLTEADELTLAEIEFYNRKDDAGRLHEYAKQAWPIIEPRPFVDGKHIRHVCEHLEACQAREITRLIINIPVRMSKSLIVGSIFPSWVWSKEAEEQFLTGSHAAGLATRDCIRSRAIMQSDWYQRNWGHQWAFTGDQNQKTRFKNDKNGHRLAFGFGTSIIGEGGTYILIDDPHNPNGMSDVQRQSDLDYFDYTLSTRLNNPEDCIIIVIMQRLHEQDLTGHLLEKGGWEHLCLPMEYDNRVCVTSLGNIEWRKEEGELLCPERMSATGVEELKKNLGPWGAASQLQQKPTPKGGGLWKSAWIQEYETLPSKSHWRKVYQVWDTAASEATGAAEWAGGTFIRMDNEDLYLVDVFHKKMENWEGKLKIGDYCRGMKAKEFPVNETWIERHSTGEGIISDFNSRDPRAREPFKDCSLLGFRQVKDKAVRYEQCQGFLAAKQLWVPAGADWLFDFYKQVEGIPHIKPQDITDMVASGIDVAKSGKVLDIL